VLTMKEPVLKALEEAKDQSMGLIDKQGSEVLKLLESLKDLFTLRLDELEKGQIARSEKLSKKGEANIIKTQNEAMAVIETITNSLKETLEKYEHGVRVWGEEKEKMGRLKDVMPYAEIVHDALEYRSNYEKIPIDVISKLVHLVRIWIHGTIPDESISPYEEIVKEDPSIHYLTSYKLTSMIDILAQYFFNEALRTSK